MKVSVIIPCYNCEDFVYESINSILKQSHSNLEILVIDDASTDNSLNLIKSFTDPRLKIITNRANQGYLRSINLLLTFASGDFIAFQDADDLSHPERIKMQCQYLKSNPSISIVGTNYSVINMQGQLIRSHNVEDNRLVLAKQLESSNPFQKPSIMFRRIVYEKIGGFREEFLEFKNISEDYDWLLRASQYFNMANINGVEPLYLYRSLSNSMTKDFHNVEQLFGHKIAQFLHQQRLVFGKDSIQNNRLDQVFVEINKFKKPYLENPSLFFQEKSAYLLYGGLYIESFFCSIKAFRIKPSLKNLRLIQYCIRKAIFSLTKWR